MRAAVLQMNSTTDRERNLSRAAELVRDAARDGAELVVLPEKWPLLATGETLVAGAEPLDGPALSAARGWAREHDVTLVAGSLTSTAEGLGQGKPVNLSAVIGPDGSIAATYAKLHMFDVDVGGVSYRESHFEDPGQEPVTVDVLGPDPLRIGLTICYDLRFPELFRALVDRGAEAFTVPAAFTATTGRAHWEPLLRARAVENQAFVLAAGQVGRAGDEFDSWGHSMIIDPWGDVIASVDDGEGLAAADLDLARRDQVRADLPALSHRRPELFGGGSNGA